jgi:hypothetical protein
MDTKVRLRRSAAGVVARSRYKGQSLEALKKGKIMTRSSSLRVLLATVAVAAVALTASGAAQAQNSNVYWSAGMSAPGMQMGVASAPPVMYPQAYPQVIYPPVYAAPRPVSYYGNNGYYAQPAPVYYAPPVWQPRYDYGRHIGYRSFGGFEHGHGGHGGGHGGGHHR